MSSPPKGRLHLAGGAGMIALAVVVGYGSPGSTYAGDRVPRSPPAGGSSANAGPPSVAPASEEGSVLPGTLCEPGETAFFSCEVAEKRVSVCGGGSGAVYRYGTPGQVELTLRRLTFANQGYSGGGESQLTAANGDYTYTVFDRTIRTSFGEGGNDPEFSSGLVIARGGRVVATRMCRAEVSIGAYAERALPTGRFVEH